ncbi:MAG TPA: choice-of-anchor I family protein [Saprospiraceae bacterium]|nr:choice-of-anchor I family protein [Saprospiraceae bacterium]HMQ81428.1 choice-of-anchor I family protein [Saprospiraceae bacterium]
MKKKLLNLFFLSALYCTCLFGQTTGDLAFTAFNADGDDGFAMVTFVDLAPNTNILFRDSEWDGTAFGTDEGQMEWNTGTAVIPAGTVITFDDLSSATPTVSYGALSNVDMGISSTAEGIFCFLGLDTQTPTTFLAVVGNAGVASAFGTLDGTGLAEGTTAIVLPSGVDIADYIGPRTGLDANGYLLALNDVANYVTQDDSGDQHNDGIAPDLPFDVTPFEIASGDVTAPTATSATVNSASQLTVTFSEAVDAAAMDGVNSAINPANYSFDPALSINSLTYDAPSNSVLIEHAGFENGTPYSLTVSNIADLAGNIQTSAVVFSPLVYNDALPNLRITEIMYNPPADADTLEFVEIWNFGTEAVALGGLVFRDLNNGGTVDDFEFVFPDQMLEAGAGVLLATDAVGATAFYGVPFLDLPGNGNLLSNGGETFDLRNSAGDLIDAVTYDDASPWPAAADGTGPSMELLGLDFDQNVGSSWVASTNLVGEVSAMQVFATPGSFSPVTLATVSFDGDHSTYSESDGTISLPINIVNNSGLGTLSVSVLAGTAVEGDDFVLGSAEIDLSTLPLGDVTADLTLDLNDDAAEDNAVWVALGLSGDNVLLGSDDLHVVYMLDDDKPAFLPNGDLELAYTASYLVEDGGSAEIVAYDPASLSLFVVNSINSKLHVLDFSDPSNIQETNVIDMLAYGSGITSVASKNGIVAVSVVGNDFADGKVVFFDANGVYQNEVTVGNLPDHVSFTPNGNYLLTANEGQPNDDYSIDPEGSVSVIDLSGGVSALTQAAVATLNFNEFDDDIDQLRAEGVRIFGPGASVSQDMEPEYLTYSGDGTTAYATCQENNALALVDLVNMEITAILPLGYKDHLLPENAFDASDRADTIVFANWPVLGMYQPDGISWFESNGGAYLITANEGDTREYSTFAEEIRAGDLTLDPTAYPDADILQENHALGRLTVSSVDGDTDNDGDIDQIYLYGGRSFTIWDATTGALVFDSGDQLERMAADEPVFGALFNASNDNNNYKNRSDNKGPEPESVITAEIGGVVYGFVGLERFGGVVVYDLTTPDAPAFVEYVNSRTLGDDEGGDLGPEGMIYVHPLESPSDTGLIVVANEISATLSIYTVVGDVITSDNGVQVSAPAFKVWPNPTTDFVFFESPVSYALYDLSGKLVQQAENTAYARLAHLQDGVYVLKTSENQTMRVILQK